jgi:PEGA domain
VELPFTIVFEPPSQTELRDALRMRGTWVAGAVLALAIGTALALWSLGRGDAVASGAGVPLAITSRPSSAGVRLDGRERGRTPLLLQVEAGAHTIQLKLHDALDAPYVVQVGDGGAALDAVLWHRQPSLVRLRPTLPGAVLSDARLLGDGGVALSIRVPPDPQLQAWRLDPDSGVLDALVTDVAGTRVAVSSDGQHAAYLGYQVGPGVPGSRASEGARVLWLVSAGRAAPVGSWAVPAGSGERLLDASWSPDTKRLLVVTGQAPAGAETRSRVWFLDLGGQRAREVLSLPSEIVAGSQLWSPDGQRVVFLAHAGAINALCLLDLDGNFRYLADLDAAFTPPLAYPPATWSADGQRLVFVAPHQHPHGVPFGWLQPDGRHALYAVTAADPHPRVLGDTDLDLAAWREDGQLVGLGRLGTDGALAVRLLGGAGGFQSLLELPLKPRTGYAATWDLGQARLLVANPAAGGGVEYWLARLGLEDRS